MLTREERLKLDGFEGVEPELFYRSATLGSNFSPHGLWMLSPWEAKAIFYKTGEHRYQAMKSSNQEGHDWVVSAPTATEAKRRGRKVELWDHWGNSEDDYCYEVMVLTVLAKAIQHSDVRNWLKKTGNRPIYEDSPVDDIWGWRNGDNYNGKNLLGKCWMQTREFFN